MRSTPHLAKILAHDAFLWEYSKRYKKSSDTHALGPDFVQRERVHLQKYRASRAERNGKGRQETRVTAPTAGAAPLTRERVMALGGEAGQRVDDGVADATASMKGLRFADIDRMDEDDRPAPPPRTPAIPVPAPKLPPNPPRAQPQRPGHPAPLPKTIRQCPI